MNGPASTVARPDRAEQVERGLHISDFAGARRAAEQAHAAATVTARIGVAMGDEATTAEALLALADQRPHVVERNGRSRVVSA